MSNIVAAVLALVGIGGAFGIIITLSEIGPNATPLAISIVAAAGGFGGAWFVAVNRPLG